jgi:uncharacterized protein (DUF427 family)
MMRDLFATTLETLRYEPTAKRIRASVRGHVVADTCEALLVWEPRRVVPAYAVPEQQFSATLRPARQHPQYPHTSPVLDPTVPFSAHTIDGTGYDVVVAGSTLRSVAFRPDDPALARHILLDFGCFDWQEEDEPIVSHPHDPFKRIDTLRSSRDVRIEVDGRVVAASKRPVLLFETLLPVRFHLPHDDVTDDLEPSDTVTYCAYKGQASYFSLPGVRQDIAWTYRQPLLDAEPVRDYVCFFDEHVDVIVDGQRRARPATVWSD